MQQNYDGNLRVLIIVNRLFEWSQNFITRELTELNEQGVELHIATRRIIQREDLDDREQRLLPLAIKMPENPFTPSWLFEHIKTTLRDPINYSRAWLALFGLRHRPGKFFRGVVCLFRAASIADRLVSRKINLIHAHFMTAPGDTAVFLSTLTGIPFGGTAHAMDIYTDNSGLEGKIQRASYLTTCTGANEVYLKQKFKKYTSRIHKVYHGIRLPDTIKIPRENRPFTFLAVGRLVPKKGFSFLLEACKILKENNLNFQCLIVGKGPLEADLKEQVSFSGLDDVVKFTDFVAPNDMPAQYHRADVLVMPSMVDPKGDRDGLPNVCLEAMSHGIPVIGTRVSGIPEGVNPGQTGWLVTPENSRELAEAMIEALQSNGLIVMRKTARVFVENNFNLSTNIKTLRQIMERHAL
jgi:glycosyltransferase involved in cell wall biosynthesis